MSNKLVTLAIGLTIAIILTGTILVPTIQEYDDTNLEIYNNPTTSLAQAGDAINAVFEKTASGYTWTVNGVQQTTITGTLDTLLMSDKFYIGFVDGDSLFAAQYDGSAHILANLNKISVQYANGSLDAQVTDSSNGTHYVEDCPISWMFYAADAGDYTNLTVADSVDIYVNSLDQLYGSYWIRSNSGFYSFHGENVYYGTGYNDWYTTATVVAVDEPTGVKKITLDTANSGYSFEMNSSGTPEIIAPNHIIVPQKIIGENTDGSKAVSGLFHAIPVIVLASLLCLAVGTVAARRD